MATTLAAEELNTEIQELYLKNKQWITDLEFLGMELEFINKHLESTTSPLAKSHDFEKIAALLVESTRVGEIQLKLKTGIMNYLHRLESFMNDSNQKYDLSLIEIHSKLEHQFSLHMLEFQSFKDKAFDVTKHLLKEEDLAAIPVKTGKWFKLGLQGETHIQYRPFYGFPKAGIKTFPFLSGYSQD